MANEFKLGNFIIDKKLINLSDKDSKISQKLMRDYNKFLKRNSPDLPLFFACGQGHLNLVKELIANRQYDDINDLIALDLTYLMAASLFGRSDVVEFLLTHPEIEVSKKNREGTTALCLAYDANHYQIIQFLLRSNQVHTDDLFHLLGKACAREDLKFFSFLFDQRLVDVNQLIGDSPVTPLMLASMMEKVNVVQYLLKFQSIRVNKKRNDNITTLHLVCYLKKIAIVKLLLKHPQIDVNVRMLGEVSPLMIASAGGYTKITQALLEHPEIDLSLRDNQGKTALFYSANKGDNVTVKLLLHHTKSNDFVANLSNNEGYTPLIIASIRGYTQVVETLLKSPFVRVNKATPKGLTALMGACIAGQKNIVKSLLKHKGIYLNTICHNEAGNQAGTALVCALMQKRFEIADLLLNDTRFKANSALKFDEKKLNELTFVLHTEYPNQQYQLEHFQKLIQHGANPDSCIYSREGLIHAKDFARKQGLTKIVHYYDQLDKEKYGNPRDFVLETYLKFSKIRLTWNLLLESQVEEFDQNKICFSHLLNSWERFIWLNQYMANLSDSYHPCVMEARDLLARLVDYFNLSDEHYFPEKDMLIAIIKSFSFKHFETLCHFMLASECRCLQYDLKKQNRRKIKDRINIIESIVPELSIYLSDKKGISAGDADWQVMAMKDDQIRRLSALETVLVNHPTWQTILKKCFLKI